MSDVFKYQSIASYKHRGKRTLAEVALELKVGESTLSRWVKEFDTAGAAEILLLGSDAEKILKLQRENLQLKNGIDFLKKISAWAAPFHAWLFVTGRVRK